MIRCQQIDTTDRSFDFPLHAYIYTALLHYHFSQHVKTTRSTKNSSSTAHSLERSVYIIYSKRTYVRSISSLSRRSNPTWEHLDKLCILTRKLESTKTGEREKHKEKNIIKLKMNSVCDAHCHPADNLLRGRIGEIIEESAKAGLAYIVGVSERCVRY